MLRTRTLFVAFSVTTTCVLVCGGYFLLGGHLAVSDGEGPAMNALGFDIDDPQSVARWESSSLNVLKSKVVVVRMTHFWGPLGSGSPLDGRVAVEMSGGLSDGISPEQRKALDDFLANEDAIYSSVRHAIYEYYKKSYPDYRRAQKLAGALFGGSAPLPEIKSGDELDPLVSFDEIIVFPATTDTCSVGIVCNCQYDENGIGILVSRGKVLQIGNAYEAYPVPAQ